MSLKIANFVILNPKSSCNCFRRVLRAALLSPSTQSGDSGKISRILFPSANRRAAVICLVRPEPGTHRAASHSWFPIWSCCGRGLPCGAALTDARRALTPPFHPYPGTANRIGAVYFLLHWPSRGLSSAVSFLHERTPRSMQSGLSSPGKNPEAIAYCRCQKQNITFPAAFARKFPDFAHLFSRKFVRKSGGRSKARYSIWQKKPPSGKVFG